MGELCALQSNCQHQDEGLSGAVSDHHTVFPAFLPTPTSHFTVIAPTTPSWFQRPHSTVYSPAHLLKVHTPPPGAVPPTLKPPF